MKRSIFLASLFAATFGSLKRAAAQTRVRVTTTFDRADLSDRVLCLLSGKTELVALDPSLTLDKTTSPAQLKVAAPAPQNQPRPVEEYTKIVGTVTSLSMGFAPAAGFPVEIYKNGLKLWSQEDFTLSGQQVNFDKLTGLLPGDTVCIVYWK
jgi:hypothetical protein